MYYRSINDLNAIISQRLHILPHDFDLIVGIPRSGMFPANLIALYLNLPVTDLDSFCNGHIYKAGERGEHFNMTSFKKILIVDDSISKGTALEKCKERIKEISSPYEIKYCVIYATPNKVNDVDFYFEAVPQPRYFQWNIMNHSILKKTCFDIDGVLCANPTPEENDDGERYRHFLLNASPLFIPKVPIGTLVTSRLEKYRSETEIWLNQNGIQYNKLVMLNLPDMRARQRLNCHAAFKAKEYGSSLNYTLFIESDMNQAIEINRITQKPVLCTENFQLIYNSRSLIYGIKTGSSIPWLRHWAFSLKNRINDILRKR